MPKNALFLLGVSALLLISNLAACQAPPPAQTKLDTAMDEQNAIQLIDQFFDAYNRYDKDKMLALHTDDASWVWVDPAKLFPFGSEGKLVGAGKPAILSMFNSDRGDAGFQGYILWSSVKGNTVETTELWENNYSRIIDVPLITHSTYTLHDGKIMKWVWTLSPESSRRFITAPEPTAKP